MANEKGVWRTIGGRRVFIKEGQDLASAMKESGKFKSASKGTAKKPMTEEEKAKRINETMDRRSEVIDRLDKETYGLDNYDRYNLALSKLENKEGMRPMERQYWAGIKERYEKNQKAKSDREAFERKVKEAEAIDKDKVLEDFKNSDGSKENFEKALNKISEMEYNNEINPDEYKESISKIQKEYVEKNKKANSDREALRNTEKEKTWRDKIKDSNTRNEILDKELDESTKSKTKEFWNKEDTNDDDLMERAWQHHLEEAKKKGISPEELSRQKTQEGLKRDGMLAPIDPNKPEDEARRITSNDIMNEKIRSRGKSKVEEDDLPKRTEIKTQGTSNRKEVSDNIQAHILDYYTEDYTGENISPSEAFVRQMDAMGESNMWRAGQRIAEGGSYLIYNQDMADFLDELKINPKGKTFSEDKAFNMYTSLIGRESAKLYDRIQKNSYKKYMKAHPLSKMSFEEFKDMNKK